MRISGLFVCMHRISGLFVCMHRISGLFVCMHRIASLFVCMHRISDLFVCLFVFFQRTYMYVYFSQRTYLYVTFHRRNVYASVAFFPLWSPAHTTRRRPMRGWNDGHWIKCTFPMHRIVHRIVYIGVMCASIFFSALYPQKNRLRRSAYQNKIHLRRCTPRKKIA